MKKHEDAPLVEKTVLPTTTIPPTNDIIELRWNNLTYEVIERKKFINSNKKTVTITKDERRKILLQSLNGKIRTGEITALIGPSGSGKTTLLHCISGRYRLYDPKMVNICIVRSNNNNDIDLKTKLKKIRIALLSHHDTMMMILTVEETLLFASKLMLINDPKGSLKSKQLTMDLLQKFHLNQCKSIRVSDCSNGQQKRLSIAIELLFQPNILLLDEPISGLDLISSFQTLQLLRQLIDNNSMTIILSIHQPTAAMLKYFNNLYVMTMNGYCIYNGKCENLIPYLASNNIHCPQYHNPADFIVEIGENNDNRDQIERLIQLQRNNVNNDDDDDDVLMMIPIKKIVQQHYSINNNYLKQFYLIWKRSIIIQYRNPSEILLRIIGTSIVIAIIAIIYNHMNLGQSDACYHRSIFKNLLINQLLDNHTDTDNLIEWFPKIIEQINSNQFNYAFLFFIEMFIAFISTLPVLLTFPLECLVIKRELLHCWYRLPIYFLAKNLVTIIPTIIIAIIFSSIVYLITDQPLLLWWRFIYFNLILLLMSLVGDGVGQFISAIFIRQPNQALIFAALSQMGLILFSGLFVPNSSLPIPLNSMTYISHYRLGFESLIITIYGFDRCLINYNNNNFYDNKTNEELMIEMIRKKFNFNNNDDKIFMMKNCLTKIFDNYEQEKEFYKLIDTIDIFLEQSLSNNQTFVENNENNSIALRSFNLNENEIYFNLIILILFIIIYRLLAFIVLYRKIQL